MNSNVALPPSDPSRIDVLLTSLKPGEHLYVTKEGVVGKDSSWRIMRALFTIFGGRSYEIEEVAIHVVDAEQRNKLLQGIVDRASEKKLEGFIDNVLQRIQRKFGGVQQNIHSVSYAAITSYLKEIKKPVDTAVASAQVLEVVGPKEPFIGQKKIERFIGDEQTRKALYAKRTPYPQAATPKTMRGLGGAAGVVQQIMQTDSEAKCGVMICANSGLPCGALMNTHEKQESITAEDLKMKTQEESIMANVLLTECGTSLEKQKPFFDSFKGAWGLQRRDSVDGDTHQGIDFRTTKSVHDYNQAYVAQGCQISALRRSPVGFDLQEAYPITLVFADSVNAGASNTPTGSMARTLNVRATQEYDFFRECVKTKLRASLDAMVAAGNTHALVGRLSCGIYAGKHQKRINEDFENILKEVLSEKVNGDAARGQYFQHVVIADVGP